VTGGVIGRVVILVVVTLLAAAPAPAPAQRAAGQPSATSAPVSREEFEAMRDELTTVKRELAELRAARAATTQAAENDERLADVEETVNAIEKDLRARDAGDTAFLATGNATISFVDRAGDDSSFNVVFRPTFLWEFNERLLFESKLEIRLQEGIEDTDVFLEAANLSYVLHDSAIIGAGKFLTPFGLFSDRFYPPKWAEEPLIYSRDVGIAPHSSVGVFLRGTVPLGGAASASELNYATWISNGPLLRTGGDDIGTLNFADTPDGNSDKAVGARVGYLPFPALEVGASVLSAGVSSDGSTRALLLGVDAQYVEQIEPLGGVIDLRAEYVWSRVDDFTFDPTGVGGIGPLTFNNRHYGGYVELSYRPTRTDSKFLRSLEFLGRYELLDTPDAVPGSFDEQRLIVGTNYWLTPTISLRAAYLFDNRERAEDEDALFLGVGVGL
jgi:hypothetical protein